MSGLNKLMLIIKKQKKKKLKYIQEQLKINMGTKTHTILFLNIYNQKKREKKSSKSMPKSFRNFCKKRTYKKYLQFS